MIKEFKEIIIALALILIMTYCTIDCSVFSSSTLVVSGEQIWNPFSLTIGKKVLIKDLDLIIEFKGIVLNHQEIVGDTIPTHSQVLLIAKREGREKGHELSIDELRNRHDLRIYNPTDDLETYSIVLTGLKKVEGKYQVVIKMSRYAYN